MKFRKNDLQRNIILMLISFSFILMTYCNQKGGGTDNTEFVLVPVIRSVSPTSGVAGAVIQLDVANYTSDYEIVIGGSKVQALNAGALSVSDIPGSDSDPHVETSEPETIQDETVPIGEDAPAGESQSQQGPVSGILNITVPNLNPGTIEIFMTNGEMRSYSKYFTVMNSDNKEDSSKNTFVKGQVVEGDESEKK